MKAKAQREDIQVSQSAINFIKRSTMTGEEHSPFLAKVNQVYSDRMTCDIETLDGAAIANVPVITKGGLVNGEVYGEVCLPAVNDYVVIDYASYGQRHKVIRGTILPYLVNEFIKNAVNSSSKQFTKKLFVAGKPLEDRRIFKNGVTVEASEDGSVIVETPSGAYIRMDETAGEVHIVDSNGNSFDMVAGKVTINNNLEVLQ
jgi:hypothetical protein